MPSIFNHESNACWPIRRSYNSLFCNPLTDVTEEVHINKVAYNKDVNNTIPSNSKYHISSNGYYGYQLHAIPNAVSENCSMDVQEINVRETETDIVMQESNDFGNATKRKRNVLEFSTDSVKRFRQGESFDFTSVVTPPMEPYVLTQNSQIYPRCTFEGVTKNEEFREWQQVNSRNLKNEDLKFTEYLLKQTHGCDLYNYDSYDL